MHQYIVAFCFQAAQCTAISIKCCEKNDWLSNIVSCSRNFKQNKKELHQKRLRERKRGRQKNVSKCIGIAYIVKMMRKEIGVNELLNIYVYEWLMLLGANYISNSLSGKSNAKTPFPFSCCLFFCFSLHLSCKRCDDALKVWRKTVRNNTWKNISTYEEKKVSTLEYIIDIGFVACFTFRT